MDVQKMFKGREGVWNTVLVIATVSILLLNGAGLLLGITVVFPHLLYIPVAIGSYRYPRIGAYIALGIGLVYSLMVFSLYGAGITLAEAASRTFFLVLIGWLIAFLSARLHEREELYREVFDSSEAGMLIVERSGADAVIREANWNATRIFSNGRQSLEGATLSAFLGEDTVPDFMLRLEREKRVYGEEIAFVSPTGETRHAIVSAALLPGGKAALSLVEITQRIIAEEAVRTANQKLHLLSRIASDHLLGTAGEISGLATRLSALCHDASSRPIIAGILEYAETLVRHIQLGETYRNLGVSPPEWIRVQEVLRSAYPGGRAGDISVRFWAERLEVYADPLFRDVLLHIVGNAVRHGKTTQNVVVSCREIPGNLEIFIEDDGIGIPEEKKEDIFTYDSGRHSGLGLFICRQIVSVTGMTITEIGKEGSGACFVIRVPGESYRVEGTGDDAPPFPLPTAAEGALFPDPGVRELLSAEFALANEIWMDYHQTRGDPATDRIFAAFAGGRAVSVARCRRHPDGLEVDAVFTPVQHRGRGFANMTVGALVEACGRETLYMHSVLNLVDFYGKFGFQKIPENDLPPTIRDRFAFAGGNLEGADVCPMKREAHRCDQKREPVHKRAAAGT